jgi:simple sugar transport system ATP-binding protein
VLLAAHPTWGVDIGAALAIRKAILALAAQGTGVLIVSEDLSELFEITHRIAVLSEGRLYPPMATANASIETVGQQMGGLHGAEKLEADLVPA